MAVTMLPVCNQAKAPVTVRQGLPGDGFGDGSGFKFRGGGI